MSTRWVEDSPVPRLFAWREPDVRACVCVRVLSGWAGIVISMISFLFFTDMCIYWIHRFLHHKLIYKVSSCWNSLTSTCTADQTFERRHSPWPLCPLASSSCFTNPTTCGRSPLPSPATPSTRWMASCRGSRTTSTPSSSPCTRCSTWPCIFLSTSGPSPSMTGTIGSQTLWQASSTAQPTTLTTTSSLTTITASISHSGTVWEAPIGTRQPWWARVLWSRSGNFRKRKSWENREGRLKWMDTFREESHARRSNSRAGHEWVLNLFL